VTPSLISVVMANYNGSPFLPAAFESLIAQTHREWELIVVDDASTDDSTALVEAWSEREPRIRLFAEKINRGPGGARNVGLDAARGDWIAVFDGDDMMEPDRLARMLARAQADSAAIVADNLAIFANDRPSEVSYLQDPAAAPRWIGVSDFVNARGDKDLGYLKPMFSRALIGDTRYDEGLRIGEDFHFLLSLMLKGQSIRFDPAPLYRYRRHSASISYRWNPAAIVALMEADERLLARTPDVSPEARTALTRRRELLERELAYENVVARFKTAGSVSGVIAAALAPKAWPQLAGVLQARLKR